jgi:hypothetical protein
VNIQNALAEGPPRVLDGSLDDSLFGYTGLAIGREEHDCVWRVVENLRLMFLHTCTELFREGTR